MAVCSCSVHARALTEHHERWIDVLRLHILPLEDLSTWLDNGNIEASEYAVLETRLTVDAEKSQQAESLRGLIWTSMRIISSF